jgi:hypothetical protein
MKNKNKVKDKKVKEEIKKGFWILYKIWLKNNKNNI